MNIVLLLFFLCVVVVLYLSELVKETNLENKLKQLEIDKLKLELEFTLIENDIEKLKKVVNIEDYL